MAYRPLLYTVNSFLSPSQAVGSHPCLYEISSIRCNWWWLISEGENTKHHPSRTWRIHCLLGLECYFCDTFSHFILNVLKQILADGSAIQKLYVLGIDSWFLQNASYYKCTVLHCITGVITPSETPMNQRIKWSAFSAVWVPVSPNDLSGNQPKEVYSNSINSYNKSTLCSAPLAPSAEWRGLAWPGLALCAAWG